MKLVYTVVLLLLPFILFCKAHRPAMQSLKLHVITFNVGDEPPYATINFDELLGLKGKELPDIVVAGVQEGGKKWTGLIRRTFSKHKFVKVREASFGDIFIYMYSKLEHLSQIRNTYDTTTDCGYLLLRNKGAASVRAQIYGADFVFINAHLEAHEDESKNEKRIEQYKRILLKQEFKEIENGEFVERRILDHDFIFWLGDLNFRLNSKVDRREVIRRVDLEKVEELLFLQNFDQLKIAQNQDEIFVNFTEGEIRFKPTFKYDKNTQNFDTQKLRKPAWCDRILLNEQTDIHSQQYRLVQQAGFTNWERLSAKLNEYTSLHHVVFSDHKPVTAQYTVTVYPGVDPVVEFETPQSWISKQNNRVDFKINGEYQPNKFDYIGLYKEDFYDAKDGYTTFMQLSADSSDSVYTQQFTQRRMKVKPGNYRLLYCSTNLGDFRVLGYSGVFQVRGGLLTASATAQADSEFSSLSSPESYSSSSSSSSSDEDDRNIRAQSSEVRLKTKSRQGHLTRLRRRPEISPLFLQKESVDNVDAGLTEHADDSAATASFSQQVDEFSKLNLEDIYKNTRPSVEMIAQRTHSVLEQYKKSPQTLQTPTKDEL